MRLYPAIDIKNGMCVRLQQGKFKQQQVYSEEPAKVAGRFEAAGASYLHVVDLDGALDGQFTNRSVLQEILSAVHLPVQTGGGIRTMKDIEERLELGAARVILGTGAVKNPELVKEAVREFGAEKIVIGIDAKNGIAAISGWETLSELTAVELGLRMKDCGAKIVIYTDIAKDGMLSGPNYAATEQMALQTGLEVIASGGVSGLSDLLHLSELPVEGAIIGKALYENKLDLKEAVKRVENGISKAAPGEKNLETALNAEN